MKVVRSDDNDGYTFSDLERGDVFSGVSDDDGEVYTMIKGEGKHSVVLGGPMAGWNWEGFPSDPVLIFPNAQLVLNPGGE